MARADVSYAADTARPRKVLTVKVIQDTDSPKPIHAVKMSNPRLPFLYPHLFKQTFIHESSHAPLRVRQIQQQKAGVKTSKSLRQETYAQRYGTAAELHPPPLNPSTPSKPQEENSLASAIEQEVKGPPKVEEQKKISAPPSPGKETSKASTATPSKPSDRDLSDSSREDAISTTMRDPATRARELAAASESQTAEKSADAVARNAENAGKAKPLEMVLRMDPPQPAEEKKPEEHEVVHLQARPYVHHFDSYSLVKDLQNGGFSEDQSVTIMKAVRGLLATNLDVAKEGLVSKSDVENVSLPPPSIHQTAQYPFLLRLHPNQTTTPPHFFPTRPNRPYNRKPTSSSPPAPNSAPKSSTPAKPHPPKAGPSSPTCNTPPTSSRNAPPKRPSPSATTCAACSTTGAWKPACRPKSETPRSRS